MPKMPRKGQYSLGDGPIQEEYFDQMNVIAGFLDKMFNGDLEAKEIKLPRETGFVLMVFPYGDKTGRCNYISNGADRRDIVTLMKEMIARFEGQPEVSGRA